MTPTPADVAAVLEDAPRVLARYGWRQGPRTLEDIQTGRWPGFGLGDALWFAAEDAGMRFPFDVASDAGGALVEWIDPRDSETVNLDAWNDAPDRTLRDVVRACYGAARLVWPHRERVPQSVPEALEAAAELVESARWRLGVAGSYQALGAATLAVLSVLSDTRPWGRMTEADRTIATFANAVMADRLHGRRYLPWRALAGELRAAAVWYRDCYQTTQVGPR